MAGRCGISGNARRDRHSTERLAAIVKGKMLNCFANVLHACMRSIGVYFSENEGKFLTTITATYVSRAHPVFNHSGSLLKQYVSSLVTEGIVKMFEVVQIKHRHRNDAACPTRTVQFPV